MSEEMQKSVRQVQQAPYPNRVLFLEVVVEFLEEKSCLCIRTDLDKLNTKLKETRMRGASQSRGASDVPGKGSRPLYPIA